MKKLTIFTAIVLFAIAISAQPMGMMRNGQGNNGEMMGPMNGDKTPMMGAGLEENLLEQVGVKEDQIQKIKMAEIDIEKDIIRLRSDLKIKGINIAEEMMKDNPDENTLKSITADIGKIRGEIAFKQVQRRLVLNKYLTKKQVIKLKALGKENMKKMAKRRIVKRIEKREIKR